MATTRTSGARKSTTTRKKNDNTASEAIGVGVGVTGGAAAGAAAGSLAGPVGTVVGAVVGGVAGGFAGKAVADYVDPEEEERYWEEHYRERPYYQEGTSYDNYRPAYRYGVEAVNRHPGKSFDELESRLSRNWPKTRGTSPLTWGKVKGAVRDAFDRTIQLHEERLRIDKHQEHAGEVEVRKDVVTETQRIDVPVEREEVVVSRRPVAAGQRASAGANIEAEEIRIPVKQERVKVSKEPVVTEEVTVGKRKVQDVERVDEKVRKEKLNVKEKGNVKVTDASTSSRRRGSADRC